MSTKELAFTILGLAATYCMPWPAAERQGAEQVQARPGVRVAVCAASCAQIGPARVRPSAE